MKEKAKSNQRIKPAIYDSRYYYLTQLKKQILAVIQLFVKPRQNFLSKPTLLDYGCGDMPYQGYFAPFVADYKGADLAENKLARIPLQPEGKIEIADSSVEIVLSTQVLEHVENPTFYLSEAYRVLKSEGILILTTHGYWMFHPHPTDYWRWTSAGLRKIIEAQGFEIQYFRGIIGRSAMGLQLFQDGLIFKFPAFIKPFIAFPIQLWMMFFDRITHQNTIDKDACTYIVVAKKKSG